MPDLPAEIWTQIFDLAADEHILFHEGIPTSMVECAWYKDVFRSRWNIRSPQQTLNLIQQRSYATKKAIMLTCRRWRDLGSEFLFRSLFFIDPFKMIALARTLESCPEGGTRLGWWTRRIHLVNFYDSPERKASIKDMETALITIISHCPNLEIFIAERTLKAAFGPVVVALGKYAKKTLHTIQLTAPGDSLRKVIWALASLPRIVAASIHIDAPVNASQEHAHLGSAANLRLRLPNLQQLSLRGFIADLAEQCTGWDLPRIHGLTLDSAQSVNDTPDVLEFMRAHGTGLRFLDLNLDRVVDVGAVLELAPNLWTFAFNGDWRIEPQHNNASEMVRRPHAHITSIGVHGMTRAFCGPVTSALLPQLVSEMGAQWMQNSNDYNIAALNRRNFPQLRQVRALSQPMLQTLNDMDGPSTEGGGYDRWNRWWNSCAAMGIRLEDCTGSVLGTLPMDEVDESSDEEEDGESESEDEDCEEEEEEEGDDDDDEEEDDDDDDDDEKGDARVDLTNFTASGNLVTPQLAQLLDEVRLMNTGRDEAMIARHRPVLPPSPKRQ